MVRKKNLLSTINLSFITVGLISLQWVLIGYTLAFGKSIGGLIGGLDFFGLTNVGAEPNADYASTIPHLAFSAYQMMFAIITPALITGAFVERVRFKAFLVFTVLWATFVYEPGRSLGLGRGRHPAQPGCVGLCRRGRGTYHSWILCPSVCNGAWEAQMVRADRDGAQQYSAHRFGRGTVVDGLVRLQTEAARWAPTDWR